MPFRVLLKMLERHERAEAREDWRFAWLGSLVLNALGAKPEVSPERLMPWLDRYRKKMSQREMQAVLRDR